jgi:hypothetical protein
VTFIFSNSITPNDTTKPSNPKDALGIKKVPVHVIPQQVIGEVGVALLEGACKYSSYNYRRIGVRASVYFDSTWRHLAAWHEGEDIDPDSGLSHITKAIAGLIVLRDAMLNGMCEDDRPIKASNPDWLKELNRKVEVVLEKYPQRKEPYTEKMHGKGVDG